MKTAIASLLITAALVSAPVAAATHTGTVERVWDDGFQLAAGERRVTVDSYDLCGDFTHRHVRTGQRLTVTGEQEWKELDAYSITDEEGRPVCG